MKAIHTQAAALPLRMRQGRCQVLLVSTRRGRKLTIPKGMIDPGSTAPVTALTEAYEEAGIKGRLLKPALGSYRYRKWHAVYEVKVYAMRVDRVRRRWPEDGWRRRTWVDLERAAGLVKHAGLREILLGVAGCPGAR